MRLITAVLATAATVALPLGLWAQDVFPDVEYIQGRTGFPEKIKGKLIIQESGLTFSTKHDSTVFTVPLATIKDVQLAADRSRERRAQAHARHVRVEA